MVGVASGLLKYQCVEPEVSVVCPAMVGAWLECVSSHLYVCVSHPYLLYCMLIVFLVVSHPQCVSVFPIPTWCSCMVGYVWVYTLYDAPEGACPPGGVWYLPDGVLSGLDPFPCSRPPHGIHGGFGSAFTSAVRQVRVCCLCSPVVLLHTVRIPAAEGPLETPAHPCPWVSRWSLPCYIQGETGISRATGSRRMGPPTFGVGPYC